MATDPLATEKLKILKALDARVTETFNRWNLTNPETRSVFAAERLLPLSRLLGGGSPLQSGGSIGLGDMPGIKLLIRWYESGADPNTTTHPIVENPQWSSSLLRVEEFITANLPENQIVRERRDAPWVVATSTTSAPLLNGLPLYVDRSHKNKEGLLPHRTQWSQTLYLACRFKEKSLFTWVNKKHPEWLDDDGEMAPLSDLDHELELTAQERMERDYILSEIAHLRDLAKQGPLYLNDHIHGEEFFVRKGMTQEHPGFYYKGDQKFWSGASEDERAAMIRNGSLTADLSLRDPNASVEERDYMNVAGKAQVLMMAAREKGQQMEEGLYLDPETQMMRQALFFETSWLTREKLMLLESWIAQYNSHGLSLDQADYKDHLVEQGLTAEEAHTEAQKAFSERVRPALANTLSLIETLNTARKTPITDFANSYLMASGEHDGLPTRDARGNEIFGVSIDDSRLHPKLLQELKESTSMDLPWMTSRGSDYALLRHLNDSADEHGYLGDHSIKLDRPTEAMLPMGLSVPQVLEKMSSEAHQQRKKIAWYEEQLRQAEKLSNVRRDEVVSQYEARLRVVETLHREQAKYLHLSAHLLGYALPKIKEPNPRYEGLKKINKDPGADVPPFIVEEPGEEMQPMLELYYPECESITIAEAGSIVGALSATKYAVRTTIQGAENMLEPHEEIMSKREAKGLPTYGWNAEHKEKLGRKFAKEYGLEPSVEPPSSKPSRPRFI